MRRIALISGVAAFLLAGVLAVCAARAAETTVKAAEPVKANVTLALTTEEGKKLLVATVTVNDKPVEDVPVVFYVQRAFGQLPLGTEKTLDDGTAAIAFPTDMPNDVHGQLSVSAEIAANARIAPAKIQMTFPGIATVATQPSPRALWSARAPIGLILTIGIVILGVWSAYGYAVFQILLIKKTGVHA